MKPALPSEKVTAWTTSQVVVATVFVVCVFLALLLLYRLRLLVFLLFAAIVVGTAIRPAVGWFQRRGVSRTVGVIIVYLLITAFAIGFLALIFPLVADQATQFSQILPRYYMEIRKSLVTSHNRLLQNIGFRTPAQLQFFNDGVPSAEEMLDQVAQTIFYTSLVIKGVLSTLAIFLLAYYWTQESRTILRTFFRLFPPRRRKKMRQFFSLADLKIGGYIRGQGILSLVIGAAAFISYTLIGLPFTLVLAIIAGIMEMIPVVGPALGAIPALLVALSLDPGKAVWVVVATILIQMMENVWLVPRIMKDTMGVNPIIILLSLVAFGSVFGFAGALLALPLAAIVQLFLDGLLFTTNGSHVHPLRDVQLLMDENRRLSQILNQFQERFSFS